MDDARRLEQVLALARSQDAVVTSRDLAAAGVGPHVPRRMVRAGQWRPLLVGSHLIDPGRSGRHLTRSWARSAVLTVPGAVVGLGTAASLLGLDGPRPFDGVQVVLPARLAKSPRAHLDPHAFDLAPDHVVEVGGVPTTSAVRTLADLVLRLGRLDALAVLDSALATGLVDHHGLAAAERLAAGRRGCLAVEDLWGLADGRAESPLESRVRLRCVDGGVAPDELQVRISTPDGFVVARGDMGFRRRSRPRAGWLLLEADGRSVHDAPEALYRDRARANALVALGHDVIRCTWADTLDPYRIPAMVRAAL